MDTLHLILRDQFPKEGIHPASSIMKLIALQNSPELLCEVFGIEVAFGDCAISTLLGVLTASITQNTIPPVIPLDDLHGFGINQPDPILAKSLVTALGIGTQQISFAKSVIQKSGNQTVAQYNDFHAEKRIIQALISTGSIDANGIVIGLDTVGKVIYHDEYITMRNTGRVNTSWNKAASPQFTELTPEYFQYIHRVLHESTTSEQQTKYMFYPKWQDQADGALFYRENNQIKQLSQEDIKMLPEDKQRNVIVSVAYGVAYELRTIVEQLLNGNDIPIYLYGGLGSNGQTGWMEIFAQCFFPHQLYRLDLASGGWAATLVTFDELGIINDMKNIIGVRHILQTTSRQKEYDAWKEYKDNNYS
jgi:hypothetical protein